jgi:hypothetical protein
MISLEKLGEVGNVESLHNLLQNTNPKRYAADSTMHFVCLGAAQTLAILVE